MVSEARAHHIVLMRTIRFTLALLLAGSALAQDPRHYNFKVHVVAAPNGNMAHLTIYALPDAMFTVSTDYVSGGEEQIITAERGGRTFRIVLRPTIEGGGTAEFEVREQGAVIAQEVRPFTAPVLRQFDPKFPPIDRSIQPPVVVERVEPTYPEEARKARISGIVILETKIDENGSIVGVNVLKPLPFGLDQAAAEAVKQWKFKPALKDGKPVAVTFNLTVNFKLGEPTSPTHTQP